MTVREGSGFDVYNAPNLFDPVIASYVRDLMIRFKFLL